jgi:hypothetical protein
MPTTVSVLINLPDDHRDAWKAAAASEGITLAEWIRNACAAQLPKKLASKLSEPPKRGNPAFQKQVKKK